MTEKREKMTTETSQDTLDFAAYGMRKETQSQTRMVFRQLLRNKGAIAGAIILMILIAIAILAPHIRPHDPVEIGIDRPLLPPNSTYLMGTDNFGRDVLSRVLSGTHISLEIGIITNCVALAFGLPLGLLSGYFGKKLDSLVVGMMDIMLAFPGILLAMAIVVVIGKGLFQTMLAIGISWVPAYTRLVRGTVISVKENVYVEAARTIGCSTSRILRRHVLPNIMAPLIVLLTLDIGWAILTGAALSFLGLGAQRPTPEWGMMVNEGREFMRIAWWITLFPGLAIMVTVLSMNLLGDGLRDALDPKMKID